jgi:hypothetical protein
MESQHHERAAAPGDRKNPEIFGEEHYTMYDDRRELVPAIGSNLQEF